MIFCDFCCDFSTLFLGVGVYDEETKSSCALTCLLGETRLTITSFEISLKSDLSSYELLDAASLSLSLLDYAFYFLAGAFY